MMIAGGSKYIEADHKKKFGLRFSDMPCLIFIAFKKVLFKSIKGLHKTYKQTRKELVIYMHSIHNYTQIKGRPDSIRSRQ